MPRTRCEVRIRDNAQPAGSGKTGRNSFAQGLGKQSRMG